MAQVSLDWWILSPASLCRHPTVQDPDPFGLLHYLDDLGQLAADLRTPAHRASVILPALMVAEGQLFLDRTADPSFHAEPKEYRDAVLVTYYNLGQQEIYNRFLKRKAGERYIPNPGQPGAPHLLNWQAVQKAYREGLAAR